jgi:hypothetical protein
MLSFVRYGRNYLIDNNDPYIVVKRDAFHRHHSVNIGDILYPSSLRNSDVPEEHHKEDWIVLSDSDFSRPLWMGWPRTCVERLIDRQVNVPEGLTYVGLGRCIFEEKLKGDYIPIKGRLYFLFSGSLHQKHCYKVMNLDGSWTTSGGGGASPFSGDACWYRESFELLQEAKQPPAYPLIFTENDLLPNNIT